MAKALPLGKLPKAVLDRHVLKFLGYKSKDIVVGPKIGVDFAAIKTSKGYLICSSDPITGVTEDIGWYAVNVSANDVSTSGARPEFLEATILLPPSTDLFKLKEIVRQIHKASKELSISVIGGHTELTPTLQRPIVVTTCFGFTKRFITSADAKEGDSIMMTKTAGVEGTSILASLFKDKLRHLGRDFIDRSLNMKKKISIVQEASLAFSTGFVNAMHDPTEGGLLQGIDEMAEASGLGFVVYEDKIPVAKETRRICAELNVDPLKLISSGVLLISVPSGKVDKILDVFKKEGLDVREIGSFTKKGKKLVRSDGRVELIKDEISDELWRLVEL